VPPDKDLEQCSAAEPPGFADGQSSIARQQQFCCSSQEQSSVATERRTPRRRRTIRL